MAKNKYTKFEDSFSFEQIESRLSGLTQMNAYFFTKRNNLTEFNTLLGFLPPGYVNKQKDNIESIDLIYSGSTTSPFLLTIAVGRNDTFQQQEKFDIDVLNIAPNTGSTNCYFSNLWHHFKDKDGKRASYDLSPFKITDEEKKKDVTYCVFLTGGTSYFTFEEYQKERPDFFELHNKSFGELKK